MPPGDDDLGLDFDELIRDRFVFGAPDEVADQILALVRRLGVSHFVFGFQWPGMPHGLVLEQTQMMAEEVFPRVRQGL